MNVGTRRRRFSRRIPAYRAGDIALFLIWAVFATAQITRMVDEARHGDFLAAGHRVVISIAYCINAALFLMRGPAVAHGSGLQPRLIAFLGSWMITPIPLLPLTWRPDWLLATTTVGLTLVYAFAIWALLTLRRNFSVFPEARNLVRHGPYALVRHPLYAVYIAAYVLVALPYIGPAAIVLAGLGIAGEVLRARHEERVLRGAFPEYGAYAEVTPRFWPRLRPGLLSAIRG